MSHGTNLQAMFRRAADMADRILPGARPADMSIERPTTVELVIDAKAAEAPTRADTELR